MGRKPNVLWITLESTRYDHTTLGGYERDTTPELHRIASRPGAHSFDKCFSPGIWTRSVSGSILTGTYPSHHGAGFSRQAIPDSLATVPELLGDVGYRSVAISPNANVSDATGLDRGFDDFVWIEKSKLLDNVGIRTLSKFLLNLRRHGAGLTIDTKKHNTGYMMTDVAKRWLRHQDDEPFFMYLHYGDPHHPYYPPLPKLRSEVERLPLDAREAGELALDQHDNLDDHVAAGLQFTDDEWETLVGLYDASIEYVDHLVGRLLDALEDTVTGETIIVITADHGELFGEYGLLGHKVAVHDALAHVPMVVDGLEPAMTGDIDLVQHMDVMESVLDAAGADTSQFQGVRLGREHRTRAIIQRGWDRAKKHLENYSSESFDVSRFLDGDLTAFRTNEFKYLRGRTDSALYRLPDEESDVSDEYPSIVADLDAEVTDFLTGVGSPAEASEEETELSAGARNQLSNLGYLVE